MRIHNPSKLPTLDYRIVEPLQGSLKDLSERNHDKLLNVLNKRGFTAPLFLWHNDGAYYLMDGHQRQRVMLKNDLTDNGSHDVPYVLIEASSANDAKAQLLELTSQYGTITQEGYDTFTAELPDVELADINFDALKYVSDSVGGGLSGGGNSEGGAAGSLAERFIVPPFSVLDTRQGYWINRRHSWLDMGIVSELGRDDTLLGNKSREGFGGDYELGKGESAWGGKGTSVFDPVLCEIIYTWFNTPNGFVLDPFAGGSVRGVVAGKLNMPYLGVELRGEQVTANQQQAPNILPEDYPQPVWLKGDSSTIDKLIGDDYLADLVFSCPPYADLEVYSAEPADISNMPYPKFLEVYRTIIAKTCAKLKADRFAVFVVGEVRGKKGEYYNLVGDTVQAFKDAGLHYYNELILVNSIGSLPLRAGRAFQASRKVGKCHQNVLVFYKGNIKAIKDNYPEVELPEPTDDPEAEPEQ